MKWKEIPFALPNESIEEKVTHEDGAGGELFYSINGSTASVIGKEYTASWKRDNPGHLVIHRCRTDASPILDMGLYACVATQYGEDLPDERLWELIYPTYGEHYRNGPYFYHQMKQFTMLLRTRGKLGGCFQVAATFRPLEVEVRTVYFPPEEWKDVSIHAARLLLQADGQGSRVDADQLFSPAAGGHEGIHLRPIDEPAAERNYIMTVPFCFPLRRTGGGEWFSLSAEPRDGQLYFSAFNMEPAGDHRIALTFGYATPVPLGRQFELPPVALRLGAADPFDALSRYAEALAEKGRTAKPVRKPEPWWPEPIVCGWREQTLLMQKYGKTDKGKGAYDYCTQQVYQDFVDELEKHEIPFGTLVIDAIWSIQEERWEIDREKWPDMRGFIDAQHAKGRHVLLWVCPNFGTLPEEEAYLTSREVTEADEEGNPVVRRIEQRLVDPLNPAYRARVQRSLEIMLGDGEGCLDADGLKLDYTGGMPQGEIRQCTRPLYGYEYLRAQYKLYHDMAKAAKPDCLLEYQVANPYMADSFDMVRLNDYVVYPGMGLAVAVMGDRMRLATAVDYGVLVDGDGIRSLEYIRHADEIGTPAVYLGLDDFARCPEYARVARETFLRWRKKIGRSNMPAGPIG